MFVLDSMHLVLLGVVKRILKFLKEGSCLCFLLHHHIAGISSELEAYNGKLPSEFGRQPCSLKEVKNWKATEFK